MQGGLSLPSEFLNQNNPEASKVNGIVTNVFAYNIKTAKGEGNTPLGDFV
jgi:hypothetical protein